MTYSSRQLLRSFMSSNTWIVIVAIVAALLNSLLNVFLPLSIGKYFDLTLNDHTAKGQLIEQTGLHIEDLSSFYIFFFTLITLRAILSIVEVYFTDLAEEKFTFSLRQQLFAAQLNQQYSSFASKSVSKYLQRYGNDLTSIRNLLSKGIIKLIADIGFLCFALTMLFRLNSTLGFIVLTGIVVGFVIMRIVSIQQEKNADKRFDARSSLIRFIELRLNAFLTIKAFNRNTPENNLFNKKNKNVFTQNIQYFRTNAIAQSLLPFMFFSIIGIILFKASDSLVSKQEQGGYLLVFILLLLYMQSVFKRILRVPFIYGQGTSSLSSFSEILNLPTEKSETNEETIECKGALQLNHLQFAYPENANLFHDLNIRFEPGSITCITGGHGSGKSTLLKLILGIYPTTPGEILLDGKSIEEISRHQLRKNITLISDELPLIGKTVFQTISYSSKEEKREEASKTLADFGIQFAPESNANLDFHIGEGGSSISSGNRKMLQYVRAFHTRKKILLIDEPFAQLDANGRRVIVQQLNKIKSKRTIIMVASEIPQEIDIDKIIEL